MDSSTLTRGGLAPGRRDRVELKNGRFVDVVSGELMPPGVRAILQGDQIIALPGLPGQPDYVPAELTVDLERRTVIPGLFNTHCHLQLFTFALLKGEERERQQAMFLADCLQRGITNIRDTLTDDLRLNRRLAGLVASDALAGPRIRQAVHVAPLGGTYAPKQGFFNRRLFSMIGRPQIDYGRPESGIVTFRPHALEQEVRAAVDRAIDERGAEYIKLCHQREKGITYRSGAAVMTAPQLRAAVDQAQLRGVKTTMHHVSVEGFRLGVEAGVSSLAHLPGGQHLTEADVRAFLGAGCLLEPTLSVLYACCYQLRRDPYRNHARLARIAEFRQKTHVGLANEYWIPEARRSLIGGMEALDQGKMKIFSLIDMSRIYRAFSPLAVQGVDNLQTLQAAGALLACGNDACVSGTSPAALPLEMEMLDLCLNEDAGHTPFGGVQALRACTIDSARAMGLQETFGTIEPGKTADLVIVDGNPLRDRRLVGSRAAAVFMDGKLALNSCSLRFEPFA